MNDIDDNGPRRIIKTPQFLQAQNGLIQNWNDNINTTSTSGKFGGRENKRGREGVMQSCSPSGAIICQR